MINVSQAISLLGSLFNYTMSIVERPMMILFVLTILNVGRKSDGQTATNGKDLTTEINIA